MQCWWKDTHTSVEITDWENIFANHLSNRALVSRIYKNPQIQHKIYNIKMNKINEHNCH